MNGEIGTYQTLSYIAFSAAGVTFAIAIYLLFRFKIIKIINDLSGRTARKTISKIRELNEQSGSKFYGPHAAGEQRGKITDKMAQTGDPESTDVLPDSDATEKLPDEDLTEKFVDDNPTEKFVDDDPTEKFPDVDSTDVLGASNETDALSTSNQTDVLNPSEVQSNLTEELDTTEEPKKKSSLKPITSVVLIHTDERI